MTYRPAVRPVSWYHTLRFWAGSAVAPHGTTGSSRPEVASRVLSCSVNGTESTTVAAASSSFAGGAAEPTSTRYAPRPNVNANNSLVPFRNTSFDTMVVARLSLATCHVVPPSSDSNTPMSVPTYTIEWLSGLTAIVPTGKSGSTSS